jgi:hypothetical protein
MSDTDRPRVFLAGDKLPPGILVTGSDGRPELTPPYPVTVADIPGAALVEVVLPDYAAAVAAEKARRAGAAS